MNAAAMEWVDAMAVFHHRFLSDAPRLANWLGLSRLPELISLTPAASDAHAGGHYALRLLLRDGTCIYYKPRPVTGEWLWDQLVHAVNGQSALQLSSAAALPGASGRYGWVASLQPHTALHSWNRRSSEAAAWWQAAGAILCLAVHVRMTDLHLANVVGTCSGPAPVDVESLGAPQFAAEAAARHADEPFVAAVLDNLLRTGLLPAQPAGTLPGISGLFGRAAPVPSILVPRWSAGPGSARSLEFAPSALVDHGNAPPGISPLEVLPQLVSGYREAAEALLRSRENLISTRSAWRRTLEHAHAPRVILRDTLAYALLLTQSLAPEHLRSVRHRRNLLRAALLDRSAGTLPQAVLRAEVHDLLRLHIPRFVALPGCRTLARSSGRALAHAFLSCSPAEAVLRAIGELSRQRLADVHLPALHLAILRAYGQRSPQLEAPESAC